MTYTWTAETLLGPIECEGDVVDFLTRGMSKADCKDLLLLGLYCRHKILEARRQRSSKPTLRIIPTTKRPRRLFVLYFRG